MGRKFHARCDYCGSTEGDDWKKGEYKLYCSPDCQRAAGIPAWSCLLVVFMSLALYGWSTFGLSYGGFSLIACSSFAIVSLIFIVRGIQARERVAQRY